MFFKKLFKDKGLNELVLDKIEVISNKNTVAFHLSCQEIIDFKSLEDLEKEIKDHYNKAVDVEIHVTYDLKDLESQNLVEKLKENIYYIMGKASTILAKARDNIKIEFEDDSFIIIVNNILLFKELSDKKIERKLLKIMEDYKLTYKIHTILQEAKEEADVKAQRILQEELQKSLEIIKNNNSSTKKPSTDSQKFNGRRSRKRIDFDALPFSSISELTSDSGLVKIKGRIINAEKRELKTGSFLLSIGLTDATDSITCKFFCPKDFADEGIKRGKYLQIVGKVEYDDYEKEITVKVQDLQETSEEIKRMDLAKEKRVELHLHTGMSAMDGINSFKEYAEKAKLWGHKALAITDHGVVQGYPEAMDCSDESFKVIYGMEGYLINDLVDIVDNCDNITLTSDFVVFDIETTGLNPKTDHIIEIGAVKISNRKIVDSFSTFVHTDKKLPSRIIELTSITDDMLEGQPEINEALQAFLNFAKNSVLVAHNAKFDLGFIREKMRELKIEDFEISSLDTLELSKALIKDVKNHKLSTLV
ncbi:MAG TPA: exonuclease domain-containing protein, partial [Sedimentibacter sp.]|nr:exonuclease domain-containing protein [Sedimentibacter sp.]